MKRALVLVEGLTEERFVKDVLREHLLQKDLDISATVLTTRYEQKGRNFRGGVTSFGKFENDIRWLLGSSGDALVTTMLDYYGLPEDFLGMTTRPSGHSFMLKRQYVSSSAIQGICCPICHCMNLKRCSL